MICYTAPLPTVPARDLTPQDVTNLVDELRDYHAISSPLFQRREQRAWAPTSLHGLLLDLERTSVEPMAIALHGPHEKHVRALQSFVNAGPWDDDRILRQHWQDVNTTLGDDDGVVLLDGSDFPKKGTESVGVQRQYCGQLGKRANCQSGVFLGYASAQGTTLLDRRLYLSQVETFSPDRSGMRSVGPAEATTPKQHFPHRAGLRTRTSASLP